MKAYLFSFQMMYNSQFQKIDPYDWFCGPGSHIRMISEGLALMSIRDLLQKHSEILQTPNF